MSKPNYKEQPKDGTVTYHIKPTRTMYIISVVSRFKNGGGMGHIIKTFDSSEGLTSWIRSNRNDEWYSMSTHAETIKIYHDLQN